MIVFDLDDTLRCTKGSERYHPIDPSRAKHWLEWQDYVNQNGEPIDVLVKVYESLIELGAHVVILTSSQYGTKTWLQSHGIHQPSEIIERRRDDNRHPHTIKESFVNVNGGIELWVDDSGHMLEYCRRKGIRVIDASARTRVTP